MCARIPARRLLAFGGMAPARSQTVPCQAALIAPISSTIAFLPS
jgi:hypothetical protein